MPLDSNSGNDANIASHLRHMAAHHPQQLGIACSVSKFLPGTTEFTELNFKQLDDWSEDIAKGLVQSGIGLGTRVVLLTPPGPEFFALVFALMKSGAIMICIDPGIGLSAMGNCINHSQPKAFIGSAKAHLARRLFAWGKCSNQLNIYTTEIPRILSLGSKHSISLSQLSNLGSNLDSASLPAVAADDCAAILFTSGSTGPPKGVVYSHATFQAQIRMLRDCYAITPGEVDLSTFPLFALFAPALGMSAVIPKMDFTRPAKVRPQNIVDAIQRYQVTSLFGSPALLRRLGQWNRRQQYTFPSLRRIISAGAPVSANVLSNLVPMLGSDAQIHTPYGATEILPVSSIASHEILSQTAARTDLGEGICVGRPVPGVQVNIIGIDLQRDVNDDPVILQANVIGEIIVNGANLSLGYDRLDNAQNRARIIDAHGHEWHRMGDSGYFDDQGRLWFCGRVAHIIDTFESVYYPIPCEGVFNTHKHVYRSALIRLGDRGNARPGLCVELESAVARSEHQQIRSELLELGSHFEHTQDIREIFFHPAFPVDIRHNAKIDRAQLGRWARSQR